MKIFNISYIRGEVYQAILIRAKSAEIAERYFKHRKPDAEICGVIEVFDITEDLRKGKPIITVG